MKEKAIHVAIWVTIVIIFAAPITWKVFQWNECRGLGHSFFYCLNHTF